MADGFTADASEVHQFAVDLGDAAESIASRVRPVVERGAVQIKNQMRREMSESRHFGRLSRAISYDVREAEFFGVGVIEAEIGPVSGPGEAGNLANIAYFGAPRGGGGTVPDPQGALDAEAPRFEKAIGDLAEEV